jgi:hypothetical protein
MNQLPLFALEPVTEHGTVTRRSHRRTDTAKEARLNRPDFHRDRGVNAALMLTELYEASGSLTRRDLCHACNREKCPSLVALIEQMVTDGLIVRSSGKWMNGRDMYFYEPNRDVTRPDWSYL